EGAITTGVTLVLCRRQKKSPCLAARGFVSWQNKIRATAGIASLGQRGCKIACGVSAHWQPKASSSLLRTRGRNACPRRGHAMTNASPKQGGFCFQQFSPEGPASKPKLDEVEPEIGTGTELKLKPNHEII